MRIANCTNRNGHYFDKTNICIHCKFDYNEVNKAMEEIKKLMEVGK